MNIFRRFPQLSVVFVFILLISLFSVSGSFAQTKQQSQLKTVHTRIINGTNLSSKGTPLAFIVGTNRNGSQYICSGQLIGKNSVLTASHCVSRTASNHTVFISGRKFEVKRVRAHPNAKTLQDGTIYYDIALLTLKKSSSAPKFSILTSRPALPGDTFAIYGYGEDENGFTSRLKYGFMTVSIVDDQFVTANYDGIGSNTCGGDSGGPALLTYYDDLGVLHSGLIAITSAGLRSDCGPGDLSTFASLVNAPTLSFLQQYVPDLTYQ